MSSATATAPRAATAAPTSKDLWFTRCPVPTAFTLALQLGLFDDEFSGSDGIQFLSLQQSPDPRVHRSHFDHTQPDSFRHGGNVPAIWAKATGADTRLIGLSWVTTPHPLYTLPGSGIRTVADLKGRRLAVAKRTRETAIDFWRATTLRIYETALATAGLTLADVTLVEIDVDRLHIDPAAIKESSNRSLFNSRNRRGGHRESIAALIRGEVDVIPGQGTHGTDYGTFLGANVVFDVGRDVPDKVARANNAFPEALTVSGRLAAERPDLVARVVARVLEAAEWAKTHHRETVTFIAREQGAPEDLVELTYGAELSQTFEVNLDRDKVAAIASQKAFLLKNGFIPADFDLEAWIDWRPLALAHELVAKRQKSSGFANPQRTPTDAGRPLAPASCSI
jgi:ABC-type nitrate/sulfonate/bicarbonate transport system substrate-binding protein